MLSAISNGGKRVLLTKWRKLHAVWLIKSESSTQTMLDIKQELLQIKQSPKVQVMPDQSQPTRLDSSIQAVHKNQETMLQVVTSNFSKISWLPNRSMPKDWPTQMLSSWPQKELSMAWIILKIGLKEELHGQFTAMVPKLSPPEPLPLSQPTSPLPEDQNKYDWTSLL